MAGPGISLTQKGFVNQFIQPTGTQNKKKSKKRPKGRAKLIIKKNVCLVNFPFGGKCSNVDGTEHLLHFRLTDI